MSMALAVDAGIYDRFDAGALFRGIWVGVMLVLVLGTVIGGLSILGWFARGEPERQFPPIFTPSAWRRDTAKPDRERAT